MDRKVFGHLQMLRERVFEVDNCWPQYRLLLNDVCELSEQIKPGSIVVSLERALLYGGYSLFAPLFQHTAFTSIDCSPVSANHRGAYNHGRVDDPRFIPIPVSYRASASETTFPDQTADLVLVPNLVHHIADQQCFFSELSRIVKPGGSVYIFEALVREIHQAPDDFLRYTPFGLQRVLSLAGLEPESVPRTEGGPFQVITYCWSQALQYLPDDIREHYSDWFFKSHFSELMELDQRYPINLQKQFSSFPMSFSVMAKKLKHSSL